MLLTDAAFFLCKFPGPKWWKIFVIRGGSGPSRDPGPEASASPAWWGHGWPWRERGKTRR